MVKPMASYMLENCSTNSPSFPDLFLLEFLLLSWCWASMRLLSEWLLSPKLSCDFTLLHSFLCCLMLFMKIYKDVGVRSRPRGHQQIKERFHPSPAWRTNDFTLVIPRGMCEVVYKNLSNAKEFFLAIFIFSPGPRQLGPAGSGDSHRRESGPSAYSPSRQKW